MMHKVELYLNEDEFERLTVWLGYLNCRKAERLYNEDDFGIMLRLGLFDSVFDLSCLKDPAEIEKMKEYLVSVGKE